jgi:hypothetical protein
MRYMVGAAVSGQLRLSGAGASRSKTSARYARTVRSLTLYPLSCRINGHTELQAARPVPIPTLRAGRTEMSECTVICEGALSRSCRPERAVC